jgi:[protein-PII] uridylyltransferase
MERPAEVQWEGGPPLGAETPPAGFANDFALSMPSRYGVLFDPRSSSKHAAVAFRRGTRRAHAELWHAFPDGSAALCVAAEDRPGLLSAIAAALVSHRLEVITALVFSRALPSGESEAVDLVWVRRVSSTDSVAIGADEVASIVEVLNAILSGSISIEEIASRGPAFQGGASDRLVARFDEVDEDGHAVLIVEAADRPGMLFTIAFEMFQHGAQILRSLVRTVDQRAFNRFVLAEFSGGRLSTERREQIRAAVVAALTLRA